MKNQFLRYVYLGLILTAIFVPATVCRAAFAQQPVNIEGISFNITKVSYGQWVRPRQHLVNDMVDHLGNDGETLSFIAVSYTIENGTPSRKIDLDGKFSYKLTDEFGNRYRALKKPDNFKDSVLAVSKNFPSLYPGETFGETLFFEAPVGNANVLKLLVASDELKLSGPVELFIQRSSSSAAVRPDQKQTLSTEAETAPSLSSIPGSSAIKIAYPDSGVVWDQGQSGRVQVAIQGAVIPRNIMLVALDKNFNDQAPKPTNVYDINVPVDQSPGDYMLNVIAQWPDGSTSSAVLKFYVKDSTPLGIL